MGEGAPKPTGIKRPGARNLGRLGVALERHTGLSQAEINAVLSHEKGHMEAGSNTLYQGSEVVADSSKNSTGK
jgi:hypothetical protein